MTLAALVLAVIALPPAEGSPSEPLLLDFHASWCGPCKTMRPAIDKLAKAGYPIKSVDIDQSPELARRYKIEGVPAFVIVDDSGAELARTTGAQPAAEIASMYRKVQAKLQAASNDRRGDEGRRPRTVAISERGEESAEDDHDADTEDELRAKVEKPEVPKPWETVVRIKMHLSPREVGYGSGTIIHSSANESIILTCAHIFKLNGRTMPPASQFPVRIDVDLFDGRLSEERPRTVHFLETVQGQAIDYDFVNDVGLIRIRPGRRLKASPVVPTNWQAAQGTKMISVGCSEGHDATAWSTKILRPNQGLQHRTGDKVIPFTVTECETAPKEGRSGGGLYTETGYVAGVCDFADRQSDRGLYATPISIYRLLDKNRMTALYRPERSGEDRLLADNEDQARKGPLKARAQSPNESRPNRPKISIPDPGLVGIPEPKLAANSTESKPSATKPARTWQTRNATAAGLVGDPSPSDLDRRPPAEANPVPADSESSAPLEPRRNSRWKPLKSVAP